MEKMRKHSKSKKGFKRNWRPYFKGKIKNGRKSWE